MNNATAALRFGVVLPTYPGGATLRGIVEVAQAAERLGFTSIWTTDHVILPEEQAGPYSEIFEPLMTLAYVAGLTEQITLGISVIVVPQRSGIVLAKQIATLDHLCEGRLVVGVGAGWSEPEFAMLGVGDRFHHRGAYLDETLRLWHHLWTSPDVPFHGRFYDVPSVAFGPPPAQPGGPPIWVGGASAGARQRAGRFGAAWHPVGITASDLAANVSLVATAAEGAGRPLPPVVPRLAIHLGTDAVPSMTAGRLSVLQGEPQYVVDTLRDYQAAGVREIICLFGSPEGDVVIDQMERLQRDVMPSLQQ